MTELLAAEPAAVYVAASGGQLVAAVLALRDSGFNQQDSWILTSSAISTPEVLSDLGPAAERIFLTQTQFDLVAPEEPLSSFIVNYEAKYGAKPDLYAGHGYDATKIIVQALLKGGGTLPSELHKGMRAIQNIPGVTGNVQFRESGDVQKFVRIHFVEGGIAHDYDDWLEARRKALEDRMKEIQRRRDRLMSESG